MNLSKAIAILHAAIGKAKSQINADAAVMELHHVSSGFEITLVAYGEKNKQCFVRGRISLEDLEDNKKPMQRLDRAVVCINHLLEKQTWD